MRDINGYEFKLVAAVVKISLIALYSCAFVLLSLFTDIVLNAY